LGKLRYGSRLKLEDVLRGFELVVWLLLLESLEKGRVFDWLDILLDVDQFVDLITAFDKWYAGIPFFEACH